MILNIEMTELKRLIKNFYTVTDFRTVIYDNNFIKIAAYPAGSCPFCSEIKRNDILKKRCKECDRVAFSKAQTSGKLHIYKCHCGLVEAVAPINADGTIIGYIMFGQVINPRIKAENKEKIIAYCSAYIDDTHSLSEKYNLIHTKSIAQIKSASDLLNVIANHLCMVNIIKLDSNELIKRISLYIDNHLRTSICVGAICQEFNIGRTKLFELSKKYYKMGINKYIRKRKITAAANYLLDKNCSVAEVADYYGFSDYTYFSKVFKSETGMSPVKYKQKML